MAAVDVQNQEGPSARTVSAVLDAAAERLAAAGVENARARRRSAGRRRAGRRSREELSVDSAGEIAAEVAGGDRGAGGAPRRARAAGLHPRPRALPRARDRRRRARALAAPRDRAAGRGRRSNCPRAPASTRSAPAPGRSPWRCSPSVPTSGSPPPTSRRRRSKPRARTPSGSASSSRSGSPTASPTGLEERRPGDRQPSLRHRLDDLRALARDPAASRGSRSPGTAARTASA